MAPRKPRLKKKYSAGEYNVIKAINWSSLKYMRESALHYQHRLNNPLEDSSVLAGGRASHAALFEPAQYFSMFAVWRGERRAGTEWERFVAENPGKTILKVEQHEKAQAMTKAVRAHPAAAPILSMGEAEKILVWENEAGQRLKARVDWLCGSVVDLKTTADIEPRKFAAAAFRYGYVHQLAFYRWGAEAVSGSGPTMMPCQIIAVENEPPHDVAVYTISELDLAAALEEIHELLAKVRECEAANRWPGRFEGETELAMPRWAWGEDDSASELGLIIKGAA